VRAAPVCSTTAKTDRAVKLDRYARGDVPHYWIADPDAASVECYRVEEGTYRLVLKCASEEPFAHPDFPRLDIKVADLWPG
jgi:Uma2 family endonuclease